MRLFSTASAEAKQAARARQYEGTTVKEVAGVAVKSAAGAMSAVAGAGERAAGAVSSVAKSIGEGVSAMSGRPPAPLGSLDARCYGTFGTITLRK